MHNHRITITAAVAVILASLSLYPIFSGGAWFFSGVLAVAAVAAGGTLTRMRRLSPLLCLIGALVALFLYLNIRFEAARSLLFLIPTPTSLNDLRHLVATGLSQANGYAPPVPSTANMLVLSSGGIGLTAVLTDWIAARLRSSAMAGLPLLMLFTEPFTVSVTRSWVGTVMVFCLGATGYLTLLSTDGRERIASWGHRAGPRPRLRPDTSMLAATGRRVGLASVVIALCVPLLLPGLHPTRLFSGSWTLGGTSTGGSTVSLPNPVSQVRSELTESSKEVLTYRTNDPQAASQYLQEYVLDDLTSTGWSWFANKVRFSALGNEMPSVPGLDIGQTHYTRTETTIKVSGNVQSSQGLTFLPMPYPSLTVSAGSAAWQVDPGSLMVMSPSAKLAGLTYTVTSLDLDPSYAELSNAGPVPASIRNTYESVPASYRPLASLARSITRGDTTPLAKAQALENYFSSKGGFTYTLNAQQVTDADSLTSFLRDKKGYCQQFAYAMAVLARLVGIPSRYAVGYTAGVHQRNGTWLVSTSDAHAWPELYFPGAGWIRFEPTPAGTGDGQGTAVMPSYANYVPPGTSPAGQGATPTPTSTSKAGATAGGLGVRPPLPQDRIGINDDTAGLGGLTGLAAKRPKASSAPWVIAGLVVAALILLGVTVPGIARLLTRRLRWRSARSDELTARVAWRQFQADLADYRVGLLVSESPRATAARVAADLSLPAEASQAVAHLALAAERARYSAHPVDGSGLRREAATARRAVAAAAGRGARWRARFFPASVFSSTAAVAASVTDAAISVRPRLSPRRRAFRSRRDPALSSR